MEQAQTMKEGYSDPEWMIVLNRILENKKKVLNRPMVSIEYDHVAAQAVAI